MADGLDKGHSGYFRKSPSLRFFHILSISGVGGALCEGLRLGYLPIQTTMRCDRNGVVRETQESSTRVGGDQEGG